MLQERIEIIKIHYKNGENLVETVRKTRTFLGRRNLSDRNKEIGGKIRTVGTSDVKTKTLLL